MGDVHSFDFDGTRPGSLDAGDHAEQRRLAGSGRPGDDGQAGTRKGRVDVAQRVYNARHRAVVDDELAASRHGHVVGLDVPETHAPARNTSAGSSRSERRCARAAAAAVSAIEKTNTTAIIAVAGRRSGSGRKARYRVDVFVYEADTGEHGREAERAPDDHAGGSAVRPSVVTRPAIWSWVGRAV